jgi:hypothetical protein
VAQHPVIGYLVWLVLFGALFAWEGLALSHISGVPTLSDAFRVIMRYPFGRWALIALTTPVYALASWLTAGRRDRAARRRGQAPRHPAPPLPDPRARLSGWWPGPGTP